MSTGPVRHLFPGGNTPQGFVSYYDYVISPGAKRIFILKGGPGTGKSTFMKRISSEMNAAGFAVEQHHCSSDNNSLDGVVIPELEIALIDGTAPHVVDPKNPGCVDEILNLGEFWDESGIMEKKTHILACNNQIKAKFQQAYRLLRAARNLYDDWKAADSTVLDAAKANQAAAQMTASIFKDTQSSGAGKSRKLFASAITPNGPVNYLESLIGIMPFRYIVKGSPGSGKSTVIQKIADTATVKGLYQEIFYCPFDPLKPEHLIIPDLGVAVTTSAEPHCTAPIGAVMEVDMDECFSNTGTVNTADNEYAKRMYQELFTKAIASIAQAKQLHDELETYYIPFMDFASIDLLWQKTLTRIQAYAK